MLFLSMIKKTKNFSMLGTIECYFALTVNAKWRNLQNCIGWNFMKVWPLNFNKQEKQGISLI